MCVCAGVVCLCLLVFVVVFVFVVVVRCLLVLFSSVFLILICCELCDL